MSFYDGAKDDLRKKVRAIFENKDYEKELKESEDKAEFQFTGDVNYTVQVEDDGEYKEYYVLDEDGNVIEIFTDDMADQDGRIPADVRQAIAAQAQSEVGDETEGDEEIEDEEIEDEEIEDEEIEDEEIEDEEIPEGGSIETDEEDMATEELPEDYAHNVRQIDEDGITNLDDNKLPLTKPGSPEEEKARKEREEQDELNVAGVYNEENYDEEQGEVPDEQDVGPDEYSLDMIEGSDDEIVSKAVELINTDKFQVQDVLEKVPENLQDNVLSQLKS